MKNIKYFLVFVMVVVWVFRGDILYGFDYDNLLQSSCFVWSKKTEDDPGHSGTGVLIKVDRDYSYILTAAHVAVKSGTVYFMKKGLWTMPIKYEITKRVYAGNVDLAILRVRSSSLRKYKVTAKPIKVSNIRPEKGDLVCSAGFTSRTGSLWSSLFVGRISRGGELFDFVPMIIKGLSGSPVVNEHDELVGIAIQYRVKTNTSVAVGLKEIRNFLKGEAPLNPQKERQ